MSPWPAVALSKDGEDFSGGADVYLESLLSAILPWATERIHGKASFIGIAGYSLAGFIALYALYDYSGRFYTACPVMETVDSGMMETAIPEMQNQ